MINAIFDGSYNSVTASNAYLHDYGQKLRILGLSLPSAVEAHFATDETGDSVLRAGASSDGVTLIPIPDSCLEEAGSFYCYIFARDASGGKTVYKIKIPVLKRADLPSATTDPTEDDSNYFAQVITEVTAQADAAAASATEAEEAKDELLTGISIGTVETLSAGSEATASFTETEDGVALNLGIPQGEQGEAGSGGGVGEDVSGQIFTVDNVELTAGEGAERFNNYEYNIASGVCSHAEGCATTAAGAYSHAEGLNTKVLSTYGHAEGVATVASGEAAHAEGKETTASNDAAHAEGYGTIASGSYAHAEGKQTTASGTYAHAEGVRTTASGNYSSHAEGFYTTASGTHGAHAEGNSTIAASNYQHVQGMYNVEDSENKYAHIVGNGNVFNRANGHTMDWNGVCWYASDVRCGGTDQDTAAVSLQDLATRLATLEAAINNG